MDNISVIIPVYNAAKTLRRCLDSVLGQDYPKKEIICIDDGSIDDSLSILQEYAARFAEIKIISQSNQGVSIARNRGIKEAIGAYIVFLDADDYLKPDFLRRHIEAAQKTNADVVQSGYIKERQGEQKDEYAVLQDITAILSSMGKSFVWNKFWKNSFLRRCHLQFIPHIYFEDIPFCLSAIMHRPKWVIIPYAGYYYMDNPLSITANSAPEQEIKRRKDKLTVISMVINSIATADISTHTKKAFKRYLCRRLVTPEELASAEMFAAYYRFFKKDMLFWLKYTKTLVRRLFYFSQKKKKLTIMGVRLLNPKEGEQW